MLKISHFNVAIESKQVIQDFNWSLEPGTLHILMGPNGSGKSSLAKALGGHPDYHMQGKIEFFHQDWTDLTPAQRALAGLFVAFQSPVEIPGLTLLIFLKTMVNAHRAQFGQDALDAIDFLSYVRTQISKVGLDESFLYRSFNQGFSGGEKKRCELLQILLLNPKVIIFDETDSGLDRDALCLMSDVIAHMRQDPEKIIIIITHYDHFFHMLTPNYVHIFMHGKIQATGQQDVIDKLKREGYRGFLESSE